MNDLQGEQLIKFQQLRDNLLTFIRNEAHPVLKQVESVMGRKEEYALPEKQLAETSFTLALVGAFQSGKSTFFNYLCDGRELSPVGPGGGGIRTSGCRVAAHPLQDGEDEYALVTWRSAKDLLNSFGEVLQSEYKSIDELDLNAPACREKLKASAWKLLNDSNISDDDRELLRFVMLVAHFYPDYAENCKCGETRCTPDEAAKISSYPQDWQKLWLDTKQKNELTGSQSVDMSAFTKEQVTFAFCGGVDLYLDSGNLKTLGCSIVDCPGLFASMWDTQIATKCIAEANAILYMFRGDKAMTQQDLDALRNCVELGGITKLIFGANLHTDRNNWKRITEQAILPTLAQEKFPNAVVHDFHSAMALRSRELFLLSELGFLPEISRSAIELDMELSNRPQPYDEKAIEKFLTRQVKKFLEKLRDEDVEEKELDPSKLENEESGAPAFLRAANNMVVARRGYSILAENGVRRVHYALDQANTEIESRLNLLSDDIETAKANLAEQQEAIESFERKRKNANQALEDRIKLASEAIKNQHDQVIEKALEHSAPDFHKIIKDHLISWWDVIFESTESERKRLKHFEEEMHEEINKVSRGIFDYLRNTFSGLEDVASMRHTYEALRDDLMEEISKLKDIPSMDNIVPKFPADFTENVSAMVMGGVTYFLKEEEMGLGRWFLSLLGGISELIDGDDERAKAVLDKFLPKLNEAFRLKMNDSLYAPAAKDAPAGPLRAIQDLVKQFSDTFEEPARRFKENRAIQEQVLAEAQQNGGKMIEELTPLKEQVQLLLTKCTALETTINEEFPSQR